MIGDVAHVCNRGVEKRNIFLKNADFIRFIDNLFLLNNQKGKLRTKHKDIFNKGIELPRQEKFVDILSWCLLPNHYHLLLHEKVEGGILEFVKRLGNAYTKYFNIINEGRSGYLFQNKAKIIPVENNQQFLYIPFYIDLNPLDLYLPRWKDDGFVSNSGDANKFLLSYKWSSYSDYFSEGNRETLINKEMFFDLFDTTREQYHKELMNFISQPKVSTWHVDTLDLN